MSTPKNPRPPRKGDWKMWCPVEGIVYYASQMQQRWDGVWVGPNAELNRHPQEFLRVNPEQPLPHTAPPPAGYDNTDSVCSLESQKAIVDIAVVDCAVVNNEVERL